jgi:hypothetical protein
MKTVMPSISMFVAASIMAQQPTGPQPRVNGQPPARTVTVTDAEILAALKNPDLDLDQMIAVVGPAMQLPAHTLQPATLIAIGQKLKQIGRESAVRGDAIYKGLIAVPSEGGEGTFEIEVSLTQILINQDDPAAMDGLAEVVDLGNDPFWALVGHGEAAVPALVRRAQTDDDLQKGPTLKAMDALEQMLESKTVRPKLSQRSHAAIRRLAADRMRTLKGDDNWRLFAAAAYLAVATGDPELRKQVEALNNNDRAFFQLGMNTESQRKASELIQQALDKFPQ